MGAPLFHKNQVTQNAAPEIGTLLKVSRQTAAKPKAGPKGAPQHRRDQIAAEIEMHLARVDVLIARLDRMDPDPDIEDDDPDTSVEDDYRGFDPETDQCEAGDHGGGYVTLGYRSGWGAPNEEGQAMPIYALDQTAGPIGCPPGWCW